MTDLTFNDPAEAAAWDMYVAAMMGPRHEDMGYAASRDAVTHNADAMLLERRKRMAPEKVEREWIAHKPGDPMPCDGETMVMYQDESSFVFGPCPARFLSWNKTYSKEDITAWRPA